MNSAIIGMAVLALSQADLILAPASEAASIVRESADALGGQQRIAAASSISFGVQGEAHFPYQGPTPEEPGVFNYGVSAVLGLDPLNMQMTSGFTGGESARQQDTEQDSAAQGGGPDSPPTTFEQPSAETFLHRDYADGVRMLFNTGGPDYHSLAVATIDGVIVIETPGSVASGKRLIDRAGELGAVKYIAATHHHGDHSGGVAGAASSDRTVVVAASHRAFFEDVITAERRFLTFEFSPVDGPAFVTIPSRGETTVGGRVVAYDAGPTGHSDAQLVFYVPDAKLLFQSDMTVFRWDGSVEPARTQTCRLRAFIREQELEVDVIVGGHGRPGNLHDLDRAIEQRGEGCVGATIE